MERILGEILMSEEMKPGDRFKTNHANYPLLIMLEDGCLKIDNTAISMNSCIYLRPEILKLEGKLIKKDRKVMTPEEAFKKEFKNPVLPETENMFIKTYIQGRNNCHIQYDKLFESLLRVSLSFSIMNDSDMDDFILEFENLKKIREEQQ